MAEITFEVLAVALETTRGTAIAAPTRILPFEGNITPGTNRYRPNESTGTLVSYYRSKITRKWAALTGQGPLDVYASPFIFNMALKGGVTAPTTPTNAVNSRLWEFVPTITSDDLSSATTWFGDQNVALLRSAFTMIDSFTITANGSGTDGTTMQIAGQGQWPEKLEDAAIPAIPALQQAPLVVPGDIEVWIDEVGVNPIGTTKVEGRVIDVSHSLTNNLGYKFIPQGPGGNLTFTRIGRGKRFLQTVVTMELPDLEQYNQYDANTTVAVRVRHNGDLIENEAATDFYHYVEVDSYGPWSALSWGAFETTNRTLQLTIQTEYNSTLAADWRIAVQNDQTSLV